MKKLIFGVGLNDADYAVQPTVNGKRTWCPFYRTWVNMLGRAYSENTKKIQPAYIGITVCREWHTFSTFKAWMMQQDWEGKALDKDLLTYGNKEYGPDVCVFVTREINQLFVYSKTNSKSLPLGVRLNTKTKKFQARCNISGKSKSIGHHLTMELAHKAWQLCKIDAINIAKKETENIKLINALCRIEKIIKFDYENNLETK